MTKLILRLTTAFILFAIIGWFSACDNPEKTPEEKFMEHLAGDWTAVQITLDEVVIENAFEGFELSVTPDKKFTTDNGNDPIWPETGSFTLKARNGVPEFDLVRDDGVDIQVETLNENSLVISFHYESTGGRSSSVTGDYVFTLTH